MATNILERFAEAYGQGVPKSNPPPCRMAVALMRHCNGQFLIPGNSPSRRHKEKGFRISETLLYSVQVGRQIT
ncbi:hypothetical protein [Ruegeria atlantica]|uniref:hypothetical protein n=1 Tax=Ruegeria atlantica TaxID=81569 RepID=UPI00147ECE3E|nr:hypothetical protein [Ruegeria atlantica]